MKPLVRVSPSGASVGHLFADIDGDGGTGVTPLPRSSGTHPTRFVGVREKPQDSTISTTQLTVQAAHGTSTREE